MTEVLAEDDFATGLGPIWTENHGASWDEAEEAASLLCGDIDHFSTLSTARIYPVGDAIYSTELLARAGEGAGTTVTELQVSMDARNKIAIYVNGPVINFSEVVEDVLNETTIFPFDPVEHRYWRIRIQREFTDEEGEHPDTIFWETSPDGEAWTVRREKAPGVPIDGLAEGRLLCGFYGEAEPELEPDSALFGAFKIEGPLFEPTAETLPATDILSTSARLHGVVNPRVAPEGNVELRFGTSDSYGDAAVEPVQLDVVWEDVPIEGIARGLEPNTTYHFQAAVNTAGGTAFGEDMTFTTGPDFVADGDGGDEAMVRKVLFVGSAIDDYHRNESAPGAVTEVPDPLGSGETVLRMEVHEEDVAPITPTENPRAQLLAPDDFHRGDEMRIRGAILLPEDFPDATPVNGFGEDGFLGLVSYYGPPFHGSGPWEIAAQGFPVANFNWQRNAESGFDIPWESPLVKERWMAWELWLRFDAPGWVRLWWDGEPVTFFAPGSSYNPNDEEPTEKLVMNTVDVSNYSGPNHPKISNYRRRDMGFEVVTVYHKALEVERMQRCSVTP